MELFNILGASEVFFPQNAGGWFPFIGKMAYGLIGWIHNHGAVGYGVAIIIFTILLKLILMPLDFATKYFTKKNGNAMAKMKPDLDAVRDTYKADPRAMLAAQRQVYQKHNYKLGNFMLIMLLQMFVSMAIFFSIFSALRNVADYNMRVTANAVYQTYQEFYTTEYVEDEDGGEWQSVLKPEKTAEDFTVAINNTYTEHLVGFLWIQNIWRQDLPIASYLVNSEYTIYNQNAVNGVAWKDLSQADRDKQTQMREHEYNFFTPLIDPVNKRSWNGLLILIVLAGVTSWASAWLSAKIMTKKKKDEPKKEVEAAYSMRDIKNKADAMPAIDPQMMGKIMKIILPAIMVIFTLMSTAALAIYIVVNSVMSTVVTYALTYPVDKLVAWQEKHKKTGGTNEPDLSVINPHAKYFKGKGKK